MAVSSGLDSRWRAYRNLETVQEALELSVKAELRCGNRIDWVLLGGRLHSLGVTWSDTIWTYEVQDAGPTCADDGLVETAST